MKFQAVSKTWTYVMLLFLIALLVSCFQIRESVQSLCASYVPFDKGNRAAFTFSATEVSPSISSASLSIRQQRHPELHSIPASPAFYHPGISVCIMTGGTRIRYLVSTIVGLYESGFQGPYYITLFSRLAGVTPSWLNATLSENLRPEYQQYVILTFNEKLTMKGNQRIADITKLNYWNCLLAGDLEKGVLAIQDDIQFCPFFWYLLQSIVSDLDQHYPRNYLLSLYIYYDVSGWKPTPTKGVMMYDIDYFYGAQAVYIGPKIRLAAASFFFLEVMGTPEIGFDDMTIKDFVGGLRVVESGLSRRRNCTWPNIPCPLMLATIRSLVQHMGHNSSLTHKSPSMHQVNNFLH